MDKFIVTGGKKLSGNIAISGAKNVALKALVASLLTSEKVVIHNIPQIADVHLMIEVMKSLGVEVSRSGKTVTMNGKRARSNRVPLEVGARLRTSSMVLGPMLARFGTATIPNPGGCRLGARPIGRHITALKEMGAEIRYDSKDGYFYASTEGLKAATIEFPKNTHTGTETIILAAVLAEGKTVLKNAAQEVEIDDLIHLLNSMGADIKRLKPREIVVNGVESLKGTEYTIMGDRNEEVTYAIAAAMTDGEIVVEESEIENLDSFIEPFTNAGGGVEVLDQKRTKYFKAHDLKAIDVTTSIHPGFMTDWQAPWAVMMTQAAGRSMIHETVFEKRFSYVGELLKMGAAIEFFDPDVVDPKAFYNFNWHDKPSDYHQGIYITGPTKLHEAVLEINDLRAGATLVLAALLAPGTSVIHGVDQIDRGYEAFESRLSALGATIERVKEEEL